METAKTLAPFPIQRDPNAFANLTLASAVIYQPECWQDIGRKQKPRLEVYPDPFPQLSPKGFKELLLAE